jgi:hypothetical protein
MDKTSDSRRHVFLGSLQTVTITKGATTGGSGGPDPPQLLLGPLQLFGQLFS